MGQSLHSYGSAGGGSIFLDVAREGCKSAGVRARGTATRSCKERPAVPLGQLGRAALARIEALGWRLIELRPEVASLGLNRYRVTIERVGSAQSVSLSGTDPDRLLEDVACHALAAPR